VILKLAHLSAVGIHCILLDVADLVDLVNDDLGVTIGGESLDSEENRDVQPVDQGLVLSAVVGHLVVDLQDVLQVIALGEMKRTSAPAPSRFREPSKYIF
jgi:hypothetical protein